MCWSSCANEATDTAVRAATTARERKRNMEASWERENDRAAWWPFERVMPRLAVRLCGP